MIIENKAPGSVKIEVQAVGVRATHYLEHKIGQMVKKLKTHSSFIDGVEIHLKSEDHLGSSRTVLVRCSIPGEDVAASDSGMRWKLMLRNVEKKLLRQLEKKKPAFRQIRK